jgi:hypothetical protein
MGMDLEQLWDKKKASEKLKYLKIETEVKQELAAKIKRAAKSIKTHLEENNFSANDILKDNIKYKVIIIDIKEAIYYFEVVNLKEQLQKFDIYPDKIESDMYSNGSRIYLYILPSKSEEAD